MGDSLPLTGLTVVLIDDSNTIRRSGEIFLTQAGCRVILAEDGFDGLSKVVDCQPDLVFIDVLMPRLDGYQTCILLKNNPSLREIPLVMLTSKDTLFDRARARLVGCEQYLIKPFNKKNLTETVLSHARRAQKVRHEH